MTNPQRQDQLREIEAKLGTRFFSDDLVDQALTHSSFVNENKKTGAADNERMEFLGDAVLKLVVSDYLFEQYPDKDEGALTKIRAAVVSDLSLSEVSKRLGIGSYLLLGRNERASGGEKKKSNLANALEAVIAAIYMSTGIEEAKRVVMNLLKEPIEQAAAEGFIIDYKSALQELCQKNKWGLPFYRVAKEIGPKHKRIFMIEVKIKGLGYGTGRGLSKKEAEQNAARATLSKLKEKGIKENGISGIFLGLLNNRRSPK